MERLAVGAALVTWLATAGGRRLGWWTLLLAIPLVAGRRRWLLVVVLAGVLSGVASADRESKTLRADLPLGSVAVAGRVVDDPARYGTDLRFRLQPTHLETTSGWEPWRGPRIAVVVDVASGIVAGDTVTAAGWIRGRPHTVRGDPVAGVIDRAVVTRLAGPDDPLFRVGNAIRLRVGRVFGDRGPPGALLAGFLVGDVSAMTDLDVEALRRAGLSHFVAVSGSNVALFLGAWFLAAGPLAWRPWRRAAVGTLGLALFLVVTRWEPSVVRASVMAELLLLGRASGLAITPWAALGGAVVVALLTSAQLGGQVGFQLSVAATAGVLVGSRMDVQGWAARALAITLGAQLAVAPLLLVHFGSIPLVAPLTNLVAAPVVAAATVIGAAGVVVPLEPVLRAAEVCAGLVLGLSRVVAVGPQLGLVGVVGAASAGLLWRVVVLRPLLLVAAAAGAALTLLPPGPVGSPTAVFFDVGQGDATLLVGPAGEAILIDAGRDPGQVLIKLRRRGINRLDLVVATHGDLDHIGGLGAVLSTLPVGLLWHPDHQEGSELFSELLTLANERGLETQVPRPGWVITIGSWNLQVLSPARRYASLNDESIVLLAGTAGGDVLLTGDIEAVGQSELGPVAADILKVPHHGAATTDLGWLERSAAPLAVISVGPNDFGHPHPDVLATLEGAGSEIRRTDLEGDVVIQLPDPD